MVRAFTLVELLVVIAIVAALLGVLLPSLASARRQGRMVHELAGCRTLMLAYSGYAMDQKDALIPGHINETFPLRDDLGSLLAPAEVVKRWPWRLAGYLGGGIRGSILVNQQARDLADRGMPMWSYMVSLTPSFGLNFYNLGGDLAGGGANNEPGCIGKLDRAIAPSRMIVFASARSPGASGVVQGYFKIVPPTKAFEYSADGWAPDAYTERGEPAAWGYLHPRCDGNAGAGLLDGHAALIGMGDLRDMTRWSNEAARVGDASWRGR